MEKMYDLNAFSSILIGKGYDGCFLTQSGHPGKLVESIQGYLESCEQGLERGPEPELLLNCYLRWAGDDKPRVQCRMRVAYQNGRYDLREMEITRKDRFGQLLEQSVLSDLSLKTVPAATEAIAMVDSATRFAAAPRTKRFKL